MRLISAGNNNNSCTRVVQPPPSLSSTQPSCLRSTCVTLPLSAAGLPFLRLASLPLSFPPTTSVMAKTAAKNRYYSGKIIARLTSFGLVGSSPSSSVCHMHTEARACIWSREDGERETERVSNKLAVSSVLHSTRAGMPDGAVGCSALCPTRRGANSVTGK